MNKFEKILQHHNFVKIVDGGTFHYLDASDRMATFKAESSVLLLRLSDPRYETRLFSRADKLNNYLNRLIVYEALNA